MNKCPFCGSGNAVIDTLKSLSGKQERYRVQCGNCRSTAGWKDTEEEAAEAWNMRDVEQEEYCIYNSNLFYMAGDIYEHREENGFFYLHQKGVNGHTSRIARKFYFEQFQACRKKIEARNGAHLDI
jgi:Lar family restriction alleviation protein